MGFSYENQGAYVYLVYALEAGEQVDSVSLGMLTNNSIRGMAKTFFTQMNEDRFIKFNVSATVTMEQFFTGPVDRRRLLMVFRGIVDAILEADEFMIDLRSLLIDMKYIFVNVSSCETTMICLPVVSATRQEVDLVSFFKNIIFSIQTNQTENCDHIARMINYLNGATLFSPESFKSLLDELLSDGGEKAAPEQRNDNAWAQPVNPAPVPAVARAEAPQPAQAPVPPQPASRENDRPQPVVQPKAMPSEKPAEDSTRQKTEVHIPTKAKASTPPAAEAKGTADSEKAGISAWYLLRHYTKENVELYKAQKDEKQKKPKNEQKKPATMGGNEPAFAIPGQEAPPVKKPAPQPPQAPPQKAQPVVTQQPSAKPPERQAQTAPQPPRPPQKPAPQPVAPRPAEQPANRQAHVPHQPPAPPAQSFGGTSQLAQQPIQTYVREEVTYGVPGGNFGETTMLTMHSIGETTMLVHNPVQRVEPYLLRLRTRERIALMKNPFRIGKEYTYADYIVTDNPAVSRSHAYIINRDGAYYIVDTNSKNHTFLNGMMLRSNTEMLLSDNDKLCFADEEFEFHMR